MQVPLSSEMKNELLSQGRVMKWAFRDVTGGGRPLRVGINRRWQKSFKLIFVSSPLSENNPFRVFGSRTRASIVWKDRDLYSGPSLT